MALFLPYMKEYALIVAGGKGTRMKKDISKQFIELKGLPILMHTINAFKAYSTDVDIILVLPPDEIEISGAAGARSTPMASMAMRIVLRQGAPGG